VIMLLSMFTLYWTASASVNAAVYGVNAPTLDMTAFLHGALRHATGSGIVYVTLGAQIPIFAAFLFGFIVKLPSVPFHTWLPDAHVEAPTGGSVLLAGVLLKMGGYGIFRINLGMLPDAARSLWWVLAILATVSMVSAAFVCLSQPCLNSFWSEFMVFVGAYGSPNLDPNRRLILIPLMSIVVTAAYYVYTMQRILFGDPPEKLAKAHDLLPWERISYAVLVALVFLV